MKKLAILGLLLCLVACADTEDLAPTGDYTIAYIDGDAYAQAATWLNTHHKKAAENLPAPKMQIPLYELQWPPNDETHPTIDTYIYGTEIPPRSQDAYADSFDGIAFCGAVGLLMIIGAMLLCIAAGYAKWIHHRRHNPHQKHHHR